jgi:D-lactate dehydrogenase
MKIAFFEINPTEQAFFEKSLTGHELFFSPDTINLATLPHKEFEVLTSHTASQITKEVIDALPQLKLIATRTTGYDHIDQSAATAKQIVVCNVPSYGEVTVAEYTFALLLSLSRLTPIAYNRVRSGEFHSEGLEGFDLQNKTLGVIGTGHIGTNVIKIARGFGMKVIAYDAYPNQNIQTDLGFQYLSLDEVYATADILTFHVPAIPQTEHMLNKDNINKLKKGMVVINTSRGSVIDTTILHPALDQGIIRQLAIDVIENENIFAEDPEKVLENQLINHPNVFVSPHNAFNTTEAKARICQTTLENINNFIAGHPTNVVKPKAP